MPAAESAAGGVYCEEGCHPVRPKYATPHPAANENRGPNRSAQKRSDAPVHLK
jgi:hypothetical protein